MSDLEAPVLEARHLHRRFGEGASARDVLLDIELAVHAGEVVVVMGPSGSGKSTLLHLLGTLDRPTSGEVHALGTRVDNLPDHRQSEFRRTRLGLVFQFHHLIPELDALENVALPLTLRGMDRGRAERAATVLLDRVEMSHRLRGRVSELSGGEQQRVSLARAWSVEPAILLADEPTGNLDRHQAEHVHRLLLEGCRARKVAAVIATHNPELSQLADVIYHLADGVLIAQPTNSCPL